MKSIIRVVLVVSALCWINAKSFADKNPEDKKPDFHRITAEACSPATSSMDLDISNVRARINTGGDMWWDLQGDAKYFIPKNTKKTSMFSGSLWIAGVDVNGQLKCAALRYRQVGNDYWPGPLTTDGTAAVDASTCKKYDKHFKISRAEVNEFISHCDPVTKAFVPTAGYTIPKSITDWPAHGDQDKKQSYYLAPFYDSDANNVYDPLMGDYPYYDIDNSLCPINLPKDSSVPYTAEGNGILVDQILKGDQTLWWVFNDKGSSHTETGGAAIGLEIRAQAFAFATNDEINNMTFYSYEIINRSTYRLTETYFSQWVDTDLGFATDDYVGCDVKRGLGYCYNGKAVDGNGQANAYGDQPPAIGVDFFQGPYMDKDNLDNPKVNDTTGMPMCDVSINGVNFGNGRIDDERFGMRKFVYHNNSGGNAAMTDPRFASEYYNFLRGIWKDGTHMMWGGNAHPSSGACGPECSFMFPGDTDPCNWGTNELQPNCMPYWTEEKAGNVAADRRFMQSAGPFTLEPGAVNYITVGIPWARATSGGPFASVELLRQVDDKCQKLFDNCFKVIDGPDAPEITIQELNKELILYLTNPISSNNYKERYNECDPNIISPDSLVGNNRFDSTYNFEGYQIFQLSDANVSISDIDDPDKARVVAQCDVKNFDKNGNPIANLTNIIYDEKSNANTAVLKVQGANKGITHSFRILNDEFASGDRRLVNHKQYYFIAITYAYNNFITYSDAPALQIPNVSGLTGQKKSYLSGRKSSSGSAIKSVTGIPHNPTPEAQGTIIHASYGNGPKIKRVEGQGNGGLTLDLTSASVNTIMSGFPWKSAIIEYENNKGPVDVKIIDPLNVIKGDYTIKLNVPTSGPTKGIIANAKWTLTTSNGKIYNSDTTLEVADEKILLDLGLSISIKQVSPVGNAASVNNGYIESTMTYADSSRRWLNVVPDMDAGMGFSFNWIRSGMMINTDDVTENDYDLVKVGDNSKSIDPNSDYERILWGSIAPYRLASKYTNGPAWFDNPWTAKLSDIASIDLVITPDTSKWSRCPVIEMCEDANIVLSEDSAKKFNLRKGKSVNKKGLPDGTGTGMGWFPGYAINVETGERLNIMFGEDSWLIGENGRDMKWNPTSNFFTPIYMNLLGDKYLANAQILFGGKHYLYIMGHNDTALSIDTTKCPSYDEGKWLHSTLTYAENATIQSNIIKFKRRVYNDAMWVGMLMSMQHQQNWLSNEIKIRIRIAKPYSKRYSSNYSSTSPINNNYGLYTFKIDNDMATEYNNNPIAVSALDMISVVPNPYYAYSSYETNQLDNRVKITNLPEKCTISIYSINGTLIRQFTKDEDKTSFDWDLKNYAGIPISGGLYIIHIKADGIGEKVIKWFGVLRPIDLNAF